MLTVLILEDEDDVREIIIDGLKTSLKNVKIFEARNPLDALDIFEKNKSIINYIICDYYLPIQHGGDLIEIIKKYRTSVKIALFTGDVDIDKKRIPLADIVIHKTEGVKKIIEHIRTTMMNIHQF